ncbi:unnamed protein product [Mucor circinelloides]|uniref:Uncharacterized protein n=1 Tax=Mucor circinelloides f. circinelloides (strain 1006PhL) TaxID=1220926 RepID=S2J321_MUCC1|nr:hypothetical protein HMPREF1544_09180 [Mucor circinelloides 1006PhL]KAG1087544.1 hypothetical protein G6F42_020569 [Rhizopus arrhizus]
MKHQFVNRLSRLFTSTSTSSTHHQQQQPQELNTVEQKKPCDGTATYKKHRWSTLGIGKKTKRNSIPVGEWFSSPIEKDKNRDSAIASSPVNVGCYYDEKVEIIVPSASINSFLTATSMNSGFQHAPFYFSSPSLSPQHEVDEQLHTPRTSIDEQEMLQKQEKTVGLATMVNHILSDAFVVADQDIFDRDDFYD